MGNRKKKRGLTLAKLNRKKAHQKKKKEKEKARSPEIGVKIQVRGRKLFLSSIQPLQVSTSPSDQIQNFPP